MTDYFILTAANDSYINTLLSFIKYHINIGINLDKIIIYDLGLNDTNKQVIYSKFPEIKLKLFNYELYPEHVNLKKYNGMYCSYAFKPIIIYNESQLYPNTPLFWLDCACRINMEILNKVINTIIEFGIYCPIGNKAKTIETIELNHTKTLTKLCISNYEHLNELETVLACIFGVLYNNPTGKYILDKWYFSSLDRDTIFPLGTSRNNHRQDQSVLSALMFLYQKNNNICFEKSSFGISCWNKFDSPNVIGKPYRLLNKNNNQQLAIIFAENLEEAIQIYSDRKQMLIQDFLNLFLVLEG